MVFGFLRLYEFESIPIPSCRFLCLIRNFHFGDLRDLRDLTSDLVGVYLLILTSEYCPVAQVLSSMRVMKIEEIISRV
jgi:hypothetical protein